MRYAALILITYLAINAHVYGLHGSYNQGAFVELWPTRHFCGVEWQGWPGTFCDVDY